MNDMQLLLFLQGKYNKMEESYKILKDNSHIKTLNKMKVDFNEFKKQYISGKGQLENIREEYRLLNVEIENLKNEVSEDEYILYNKCGNDLKAINTLQNEIESKNKTIAEKENEGISILEREEGVSSKVVALERTLKKIRDEFNGYKKNLDNKLHTAKEEVKECEKEIENIRSKLPVDILKEFDYIKSQKKVAVALLENGVCTGCKIKVSSLTLDEINKGNEIVYCDNCGRILCK